MIVGLLPVLAAAQDLPKDVCLIVDGKTVFHLDTRWTLAQRSQLVRQYSLDSTLVAEALRGVPEIIVDGTIWVTRKLEGGLIELAKTTDHLADLGTLLNRVIMFNDQWLNPDIQTNADGPSYGVNKFTRTGIFTYQDSIATINLPGYGWAQSVFLSGSFNDWSTGQTPMTKTGTGWTINLRLGPGYYPYKYIIAGRWTQDPNNQNREDDLNGGNNSVFYCYNYTFHLNGYTDARKVNLAGSFNGFNPNELEMIKTDQGWILPMYLRMGTYSYKFIVDGRWMTDPDNPVIRGDGRGNQNSFIGFGDSTLFKLSGFQDAQQVELAGSFNNWQWGELVMDKTDAGWQLPYALGPGNYEYKYIVDGRWITDPANPYTSGSGEMQNSFMAMKPNHAFVLDGFPEAQTVIVCGSFNNWQEDGYWMARIDGKWTFPICLKPGKYTYKFIVDGQWILDPGNSLWEPNEYGTDNSVVWIE
ncbi:MAG: hypothetical protein V2A67_03765 [Bacteroidota bacterium]